MFPELPDFTGAVGVWMLIALKSISAAAFMMFANVVILYAS